MNQLDRSSWHCYPYSCLRIPLSIPRIQLVLFGLHLHYYFCCFEQHSHFHSWLHQHWYLVCGCVSIQGLKSKKNYLVLFGMHLCCHLCCSDLHYGPHQHSYVCLWTHFFLDGMKNKKNQPVPCDYYQHRHLCSSIKHFCIYVGSTHKFVFYSSRYLGLDSLPILHIGIRFSISISGLSISCICVLRCCGRCPFESCCY